MTTEQTKCSECGKDMHVMSYDGKPTTWVCDCGFIRHADGTSRRPGPFVSLREPVASPRRPDNGTLLLRPDETRFWCELILKLMPTTGWPNNHVDPQALRIADDAIDELRIRRGKGLTAEQIEFAMYTKKGNP